MTDLTLNLSAHAKAAAKAEAAANDAHAAAYDAYSGINAPRDGAQKGDQG